jgi:zinc transport system permease protein
VGAVNFAFTLLTALTVSIAARTVGALIVSSLMVVPVATAMQWARSFRQTVVLSILFAAIAMAGGLLLSFYIGFRPGGAVVILGILLFLLSALGKRIVLGRAL